VKKKKRVSIAVKLFVVLFSLYAAVQLVGLYIKNVKYKEENASLLHQVEQQKTINNQLKDMTSGDPSEEEIASIARDDLGYGYPGEQVFVDTSSK